jgi:phosphoribosyl 1,2-cyclic phosphate phosphodiesterase
MTLDLTILGCGSSAGVPRVGQGWGACDPDEPNNRRRRCSALLRKTAPSGGETVVLIDTSPDLRAQLLDADVGRLDAILLTHSHADHTHGIDDVRPLVQKAGRRIDIYMDDATSKIVTSAFPYIFKTPPGSIYEPLLDERRLRHGEICRIGGPGGAIEAMPFLLDHGEIEALGFRIGDTAYTPDLKWVPAGSEPYLRGLDLWIIDCLRFERHSSHLCVDETFALLEKFAPRRAVLTNLGSELDYRKLTKLAPASVVVAHDGMQIRT